jgi:hypothetical protein
MKVGRVAIITRGRYAGKKVRLQRYSLAIEMHMCWKLRKSWMQEKKRRRMNVYQQGTRLGMGENKERK